MLSHILSQFYYMPDLQILYMSPTKLNKSTIQLVLYTLTTVILHIRWYLFIYTYDKNRTNLCQRNTFFVQELACTCRLCYHHPCQHPPAKSQHLQPIHLFLFIWYHNAGAHMQWLDLLTTKNFRLPIMFHSLMYISLVRMCSNILSHSVWYSRTKRR